MKEVRLDLFKLHDENDRGQGRIKVKLNENLKILLKNMVNDARNNDIKIKDVSNFLGLPYYEFWRCLNLKHIPLDVVEKLIQLWCKVTKNRIDEIKNTIQKNIESLSHGAGNTLKTVDSPKVLTENLCKITGAVVADGHLRNRRTKSGMLEYSIIVRDWYKDNLLLFCNWIKNEFNIELELSYSKNDHHWYVSFGNKIVFRYLNKIFEIPFGKKSDIVKMPQIIRNSSLNFQNAFVTGILMFDGGVDHRTGYFDLSTKSKFLVKDVERVLTECNIRPDYVSNDLDHVSGVYKLRIRKRGKLEKLLKDFIESNTTKWVQLHIHLNGFNEKMDLNDLLLKLNSVYPRIRDGVIFEDVINIVKECKFVTVKQMQKELNRRKTVVYEYLRRLEDWKILNSSRSGLYKVWSLNPNLKSKLNGGDRI